MLVDELLLDGLAKHGCVLVVGEEGDTVFALPCGHSAVVVKYDGGDDTIQITLDRVSGDGPYAHSVLGPGEECVDVAVSMARVLTSGRWATEEEVAANPSFAAAAEFIAEESMAEV